MKKTKLSDIPPRNCRFWDEPLSPAEEHERLLRDQWHAWQQQRETAARVAAEVERCVQYDGELPW